MRVVRLTLLALEVLLAGSQLENRRAGPRLPKRNCNNPAIHQEWRNTAASDLHAYVQAEKCLFSKSPTSGLPGATSRIEDLAAVHQNMTSIIHNVGQFLPWHRFLIHAHETLLRKECGYSGPMIWWDETKDAGNFHSAPMFTSEYMGSLPARATDDQPTCITDGAFANTELSVGPGSAETPHCLSRAVDETLSAKQTQSFVDICNNNDNYTSMWQCVFPGPHAYGHDAVGGVMADVDSSPGDPVFYLHHAFVDHNWHIWQTGDPTNRLYQINGYTTPNCVSNCQETTLNYELDIFNIIGGASIEDVMDTQGGYLCYKYDY